MCKAVFGILHRTCGSGPSIQRNMGWFDERCSECQRGWKIYLTMLRRMDDPAITVRDAGESVKANRLLQKYLPRHERVLA